MIKVYASIASVGFLVLAGAAGCSSANTPDDEGSGGKSTAGTNSNAGTTVVPTAGTPSTSGGAGTAGTPSTSGGTPSAGTGSGGTPPAGAACKGISTGAACAPEGQACPSLLCGLADSGTRMCSCETTWMCSSCDYTSSPFKDKPADIMPCTTQADKLPCDGMEGVVCDGAPGGEVCACYLDDEAMPIWDCDKPPTTWAAAAM